jgi:hypothetical protein
VQIPCAPGSYNPNSWSTSSAECTSTPPGAWSGSGAATYEKCPAGTYEPVYSAVASGACLPDPPGTYSAEFAWEVNPCRAGTYATGAGNTGCSAAQPGYFVEDDEASAQAPCEPGTFAAEEASTSCAKAPAGSFVEGPGGTSPTSCPPGTFAEATGSLGCTATPPNTYSAGGAAKPTPCPAGTEAPGGAGACTPKPGAGPESERGPQGLEHSQESQSSKGSATDGSKPPLQSAGAPGQRPSARAPVLSGLSLAHACLAPSELAGGKKGAGSKSRNSPSIGFRLNEPAKVSYTLSRLRGATHRPACRAGTTHGHSGHGGERISIGSSAYGPGAGSLSIARLLASARSRKPAPGAYELTLTASNAAGERSAPVSLDLWILGSRRGTRH